MEEIEKSLHIKIRVNFKPKKLNIKLKTQSILEFKNFPKNLIIYVSYNF